MLEIGLFCSISFFIAFVFVALGFIRGPRRPDKEKRSPYECGFEPIEDKGIPINIHFYRVAILFVLFDIEIALMIPWAANIRTISFESFFTVLLFAGILAIGLIYEYCKGALEWK
jgi:NADH-quinone oxidoreductase subunit A